MKTLTLSMVVLFLICTACKVQDKKSNATKPDYEISVNQSFQIELAANPSTGYSWKWSNQQAISIVDTAGINYVGDNPGLTGSGGKAIWKFKGKKTGVDTLKLEYCRSWEPNSTVETKKIVVKVN